jgi:acyl-CoA synthetase (AMP-forming)/AMP-acid ligase II
MTAVVPEMDFTRPGSVDPPKILEAIENWNVTSLFGSPALLDRVGTWCAERGVALPSLRRVISAGAPVAGRIVERFAGLLSPDAEVFTPYGATEALPVASIGSKEILGQTRQLSDQGRGTCVGRPVDGIRARIIKIDDGPIERWTSELLAPPGEIGEIVVSGSAVTTEYYNRPESTRLVKIRDLSGETWHRMGDLGYFDDRGRLWFCGRKSQRIVTPAGPRFTIPCEGVFNSHHAVKRSALVPVRRDRAVHPALCVELLGPLGNGRREQIRDELLTLGAQYAHTRDIREIHFHPGFPVDIRHNAKIGREKLARWAQARKPA